MYGTIGRTKINSGMLPHVLALGEQWKAEMGPKVPGAIATYWFQSDNDPSEMTVVAIFRDRETYHTNARSQAQDEWYRQLTPFLDGEPTWNDGEIILSGMYNGI